MSKTPLCWVPWGMMLVDTNKVLKPCCTYQGNELGRISEDTSITDILNDTPWQELKNKLSNQEWPDGCKFCHQSELDVGWSPRIAFNNDINNLTLKNIYNKTNKIVFIEFNGSNICNLECLHCSPHSSSKWHATYTKKEIPLEFHKPEESKYYRSNPTLLLKNLEQLDLTQLSHIVFKGGEPMLNSETLAILEHLDKISILQNIKIDIFTNGTIKNKELVNLLTKAKICKVIISIDGIGPLNEYIRYGVDTIQEDIEHTMSEFSSFQNVIFSFSVSVMVYNIFNLVEIRDYCLECAKKYKTELINFNLFVTHPAHLDPRVLSNDTRKKLIEYYSSKKIKNEFLHVISLLSKNYVGDILHNKWVDYTHLMEKQRGNSITELVPQLKNELRYFDNTQNNT